MLKFPALFETLVKLKEANLSDVILNDSLYAPCTTLLIERCGCSTETRSGGQC